MGDEERIMTVRLTAAQYDALRYVLECVTRETEWQVSGSSKAALSRALARLGHGWDTGKRY